MMLLAAAGDLVVLFLALELMSLSLYVLAGLFTQALASSEASMKYFILGAFASSFMLDGIALMYGATGTTNLDRIAAAAAGRSHDPLFMIGVGLLLVGFGFKTSSVPFHMWAPDVYQGAPTSVTALIATGSKAAAFAALIRVLVVALRGAQPDWTALLWVVAAKGHDQDADRSEEHTSELQSHHDLVCRLLLGKKKKQKCKIEPHTTNNRSVGHGLQVSSNGRLPP